MVDITHKDAMESNSIEIDGIEFVKVVRCRDCKWWQTCNLCMRYGDDWFCASGEKRDQ